MLSSQRPFRKTRPPFVNSSLRRLGRKIRPKLFNTAFAFVLLFSGIVFLTRTYFGASKGMVYLKGEDLKSTDIDSDPATVNFASFDTFATLFIFCALRLPGLIHYFFYNHSKVDLVVGDGLGKSQLIKSKTSLARINNYLFMVKEKIKDGKITNNIELIKISPSSLKQFDSVLNKSLLSNNSHRTLTTPEWKWVQKHLGLTLEHIHDKSVAHGYAGRFVGGAFKFILYPNLVIASQSAFLGTVKSCDSIYRNSGNNGLSFSFIIGYAIQNLSFNVKNGKENADSLERKIREGKLSELQIWPAIFTGVASIFAVFATVGFYVLGVEGLKDIPGMQSFYDVIGDAGEKQFELIMRIISGVVGLLYPLIVQVPPIYDAFSGGTPVQFPSVSSPTLRTLSFGYLENYYKVYFATLCFFGLLDAFGGATANGYSDGHFLSTRTSQNPYSPGYVALISLTMLSSMIMVFYFNAYSPAKANIPKELMIDLDSPEIKAQIEKFIADPTDLETKELNHSVEITGDLDDADEYSEYYLLEDHFPEPSDEMEAKESMRQTSVAIVANGHASTNGNTSTPEAIEMRSSSTSYMNYSTPTRTTQVPANFHHQSNGLANGAPSNKTNSNGHITLDPYPTVTPHKYF